MLDQMISEATREYTDLRLTQVRLEAQVGEDWTLEAELAQVREQADLALTNLEALLSEQN